MLNPKILIALTQSTADKSFTYKEMTPLWFLGDMNKHKSK